MKSINTLLIKTILLAGVLTTAITMTPAASQAQDRKAAATYHDKQNNDEHEWNNREDKAYRAYAKENHRKYVPFARLKEDDQQAYWGWRHQHSDTQLNINIH